MQKKNTEKHFIFLKHISFSLRGAVQLEQSKNFCR